MQPFQAVFAVPMTCDGCAKDITKALRDLSGVDKADANATEQLVMVQGTASPSAIVAAIQKTGRDAILRGSGESDQAAVCILEIYDHQTPNHGADSGGQTQQNGGADREVRGLARLVQVSPSLTLVDLSLQGLVPGKYHITVRKYGDVKDGAVSAGPVWIGAGSNSVNGRDDEGEMPRGALGIMRIGDDGRGNAFLESRLQVWEVIGHAMVVSRQEGGAHSLPIRNDANTVVGVIARSAGVWDNDKTVCSCTGKTLWDERKDLVEKGML